MPGFERHIGKAAPLRMHNVDTDVIITMDNLLSLPRSELGRVAFSSIRYHEDGSEVADFVLNQEAFRGASILVAGRNFGAGSSREGAVYALVGLGIQVIVASSFGDIFFGNCIKNGVLPARVDEIEAAHLLDLAETGTSFEIDLQERMIVAGDERFAFVIDDGLRARLLDGADEIAATLTHDASIVNWQKSDRQARPWVWSSRHAL